MKAFLRLRNHLLVSSACGTVILFAFSLWLISCAAGMWQFGNLPSTLQEIGLDSLPPDSIVGKAEAIVLHERQEGFLELTGDGTPRFIKNGHVVMQVFKNFNEYSTVELQYGAADVLKILGARTVLKDGTSIPVGKDQFYYIKGQGSGQVLYSDVNTVRFVLPRLDTGAVLEYRYVHKSSSPLIFQSYVFQRTVPVLKTELRIFTPGVIIRPKEYGGFGWGWRFKEYNIPQGVYLEGKRNQNDDYLFELRTAFVPSAVFEPFMPPVKSMLGRVEFSLHDWNSWERVGEWYFDTYCKSRLESLDSLEKVVKNLTRSCRTDMEKLGAVYDYVRRLKYVFVALGDGGLKPARPLTVMQRGYGDCKDKSILMVALLRTAGIPAWPALVLTANEGSVDMDFPTFQFNHMIVKTTLEKENSVVWCDPTAEDITMGKLPWADQGIPALVLDEYESNGLQTTPQSIAADNLTRIVLSCSVDVPGSRVHYRVDALETGVDGLVWKSIQRATRNSDVATYIGGLLAGPMANVTVDTAYFPESNGDTSFIRIRAHVDMNKEGGAGLSLIPVKPLKLWDLAPFVVISDRSCPLCIPYPRTFECEVTVVFDPTTFSLRSLPEPDAMDTCGISNDIQVISSTGRCTVRTVSVLEKMVIQTKEYDIFRKFAQKVIGRHDHSMVLEATAGVQHRKDR